MHQLGNYVLNLQAGLIAQTFMPCQIKFSLNCEFSAKNCVEMFCENCVENTGVKLRSVYNSHQKLPS